jgi:capsular exopolysaccharide synthesis family protein
MDSFDLQDIIRPLLKWWWLLAASALLAAGFSAYNISRQPPIYRSSATVMVGRALSDPNPSGGEFNLASQLAAAYTDIARRSTVQDAVRDALGLARLPEYSVRQVPNTQIIEIIVQDTEPTRAKAVANEIVNQLILQTPGNQNESERQVFVEEQLNQMEASIIATREEIERLNQELQTLFSARQIADTNAQIAALNAKLSTLQTNYTSLLSNSRRGAANTVSVLEPAYLPTRPLPNQLAMYILVAGLLGFALAAVGAYLLEYLDDTLRTEQDAHRHLKLPALGIIPVAGKRNAKDDDAILDPSNQSPATDGYSGLRLALDFVMAEYAPYRFAISSPGTADGKSKVTANLCVELAHAGRRVILVDADLHRPSQQRIFKLRNDVGVTTLLLDENAHVGNLIQQTPYPGLSVLTSGPLHSNPSQLLGTKGMSTLLDQLQEMADVVILDTPPVTVAIDASILATQVDGVLLVLAAGQTKRGVAMRAVESLRKVHANLLGFVLNDVPLKQSTFGLNDYSIAGFHTGKASKVTDEPFSGSNGSRQPRPVYRLTTSQAKGTASSGSHSRD